MIDPPKVVPSEARQTAVIRLKVPRAQIREVMGPAIGEVMAAVAGQGIGPAGPVFSHHFRMSPELFDFEVGVPVTREVKPVRRVQASTLPAETVARTIYRGPYEGLGDAWAEFQKWIVAAGHQQADNLWECYVRGPESGPDATHWETELNRPLVIG